MAIWNLLLPCGTYPLLPFGNLVALWYIFPLLVYCVKKNLANLLPSRDLNFDLYLLKLSVFDALRARKFVKLVRPGIDVMIF
jgi:hypothetical protein